jgi:gluconolactonase
MAIPSIDLATCRKVGIGLKRPEDVVVSRDGEIWASDQMSACARIEPDGSLTRVGLAHGAPNGINLDLNGNLIIANFGGPEDGYGPLQRLDPRTGQIQLLCGELQGRKIWGANYPLVDRRGRIWCSHSTWGPLDAAFNGRHDGMVFRRDPDGRVIVLADGIKFANGLALDFDERNLFVCETAGCDVIRYPIAADGTLGTPTRYGPSLGLSNLEVQDRRPLSLELRSQLGATDGCGFDQEGNLWVTLVMANKIVAITPAGEVVTVLSDPEGRIMRNPTNISFGGADLRDVYIGSVTSNYVVHARSPIPGMPLVHQR